MVIRELELINYRNYTHTFIKFSPQNNIFWGENGQGKTNIIEAIFFLCNLTSFRTNKLDHLIKNSRDYCVINAKIENNQVLQFVKILITKKGKKIWLDNTPSKKASSYIQAYFALSFAPDDSQIFKTSSVERKKIFDRAISVFSPGYIHELQEYIKVIEQKNKLLKTKDVSQLHIWNNLLSKFGKIITVKREKFVKEINEKISQIFFALTGRLELLKLNYEPSILDTDSWEDKLFEYMEKELRYGYSLIGPHKDNYQLFMDEYEDRIFFSKGELKISCLALKLAVNQIFIDRYQIIPILVIDDIFSELDQNIAKNLMSYLSSLPNQIFVTSTYLTNDVSLNFTKFRVINAELSCE
ncbi:MAG: DNA replication/repair protein RecF [SAR324 cluster bacterium]|nr:DNA replication/repair protein RecF [SAR324 cluster bacterium]